MWLSIAAVVSIAAFGVPLALAVDRNARGALLAGLSYLYGSGLVYAVLLGFSILGLGWSLPLVQGALVAFSGAALYFVLKKEPDRAHPAARRPDAIATIVDLLSVATLLVFAWFATAAPLWQWDFWAIWGLKGRVFLESSGVDWAFLQRPWNEFAHPDYPLLLPLQFDYFALLQGGWEERWLGLHAPAFAAALLLVVRHEGSRRFGQRTGAVMALGAAAFMVTPYVGLADGPMMAFAAAGLLLLERGLRDEPVAFRHGALLLGLAGATKNEGLSLLAATAVAVLAARGWRTAIRLWPAAAIVAPWLFIRVVRGLETDLASGPVLDRLRANLGHLSGLAMLGTEVALPVMVVVLIAGAIVARKFLGEWQVTLAAVAMQFIAYMLAYLVTPHTIEWHVQTSWTRLSAHLLLPLLLTVMQALAMKANLAEDARSCRSSIPPQTNSAPPATS